MDTIIYKEDTDNETHQKVVSSLRNGSSSRTVDVSNKRTMHSIAAAVLSVLTVLLTLRYVIWRCSVTQWHLWWLSLPLLAAELFTALHIIGYQYTVWPRRISKLEYIEDISRFPIFVFIPTVNEGDDILGPTIAGALAARARFLVNFPQAVVRIIVCNDAYVAGVKNWQSVEALAERLGVECLTRTTAGGAKAGNIEHVRRAVNATGDCLIAILDADQVAEPEFLVRAIEPFGNSSVGWVQTRQYYRNTDRLVPRWAESQATLFYDLVCPGKSTVNASYICGTNVIIRGRVLDQIGGFPTESVTEDFAASIRTHQTWRSVYIKDTLAKGLGPLDLSGYFVQQARWARGTMGVLRSDWTRLILPSKNGLSADQRIQYFLSGTHYICGLRDLIFLMTALVSLALSESPIKHVSLLTICFYLIPYILASQALLLLQAGTASVLNGMIIGYISFPTLVLSLFEAVVNRKMRFRVTPKSSSGQDNWRVIIPHITVMIICIAVLARAIWSGTAFTTIDLIPLVWVVYALCILTPVFFLVKSGKIEP